MDTTRAKIISVALALGLLVAGAFAGAVIDRRWIRDPGVTRSDRSPRTSERVLQRFTRRLNLDDKQAAAIAEILKNTRAESQALRQKRRQEINQVLTPAQQNEYKKMVKRSRERRNGRRGNRRGKRTE